MGKYRIKKGFFQKPRKGKLLRKVFVVQKRLIWGIWLKVSSANAENDYYFQHEKQAKVFLKYLEKINY